MSTISTGPTVMLEVLDNAVDTVAAAQPGCTLTSSNFGFRICSQTPLRFLRSGGGAETLDVTVAPEPRSRPATPPLVEWTFRGPDREVRCTLYQIQRAFELWASDMGAYHIDPTVGRIEMPESDDALMREQRMWGVPAALCCMHRGDLPLHAAAARRPWPSLFSGTATAFSPRISPAAPSPPCRGCFRALPCYASGLTCT